MGDPSPGPGSALTDVRRHRSGKAAVRGLILAMGLVVGAAAAVGGVRAQDLPAERTEEPPMPEAPDQFRLGVAVSRIDWDSREGSLPAAEDGASLGLEVESLVQPFLSFRLGVAFSQPEVRSSTDRVSTDQYLLEVLGSLRWPYPPFERLDLTPFFTGGYGSVVHAPERDDLITKNQSAFVYGPGLEWNGFPPFGARLEWRRSEVEVADVFDPRDRDSSRRTLDRWVLGAYWRF